MNDSIESTNPNTDNDGNVGDVELSDNNPNQDESMPAVASSGNETNGSESNIHKPSESNYFKLLTSEVSEPSALDFDKNTTKIGYSKKPHKLYWVKYDDIGIKIGIVQIDEENNKVNTKLTNSSEHFDSSSGRTITNWSLGETIYLENNNRILKINLTRVDKKGRGFAYFNIKSWLK